MYEMMYSSLIKMDSNIRRTMSRWFASSAV